MAAEIFILPVPGRADRRGEGAWLSVLIDCGSNSSWNTVPMYPVSQPGDEGWQHQIDIDLTVIFSNGIKSSCVSAWHACLQYLNNTKESRNHQKSLMIKLLFIATSCATVQGILQSGSGWQVHI